MRRRRTYDTAADKTAAITIPGSRSREGVAVPDRPLAPGSVHTRHPPSEGNAWGPSIGVRYSTPMSGFGAEARRHARRRGTETEHVPLHSYWTTYNSMDDAQTRWYFYWRDQFRNGIALKTDLSYIFVHVYECLHLAGFERPGDALGALTRLWTSYRDQHPKLIGYLLPWTQDLNAYYGLGENAVDLALRCFGEDVAGVDANLWIHWWLAEQRTEVLDLGHMYLLSGFDPRTGKFVAQPGRAETLEGLLQSALAAANDYYRESFGVAMFRVLFGNLPHRVTQRLAFAGAVFSEEPRAVQIEEPPWYSTSAGRDVVAGILRTAENRLRVHTGFRGLRRGDPIDSDLERFLLKRLGLEEPARGSKGAVEAEPVFRPRTVNLDPERLAQLSLESDEIRSRLVRESSAEGNPSVATDDPRFEVPADTPTGLLTDVARVAAILDSLPAPALRLLHDARASGWEMSTATHEEAKDVADRSTEYLGEPLIVSEAGTWVVEDDYRDELDFLLSHPVYAPSPTPGEGSAGNNSRTPATNGDGQTDMTTRLEAVHLNVLSMLLEQRPTSELRWFAMQNAVMLDVVLDEINERLEPVAGDLVVDISTDPPSVREEHVPLIESIAGSEGEGVT